jgi:hypothetical protein
MLKYWLKETVVLTCCILPLTAGICPINPDGLPKTAIMFSSKHIVLETSEKKQNFKKNRASSAVRS